VEINKEGLMNFGNSFAHRTAPVRRLIVTSGIAVALSTALTWGAAAEQNGGAIQMLRAMSDYTASQKNISLTYDSDIEVITPELQKIQFASSGKLLLSRPDKLRVTRTGGYTDVELVFDGKTITVLGKDANSYAQVDATGSVDQVIDRLRGEYGVAAPGADLLLSRTFDQLMEDVIDAAHIGRGVVDGVECEHLAFRNAETDWQLWIEAGDRPIPRKYVITSKAVAGAPQYTLRIKEWKTDAPLGADAFAFAAPQGAKKVNLDGLSDVDEVPQGVVKGSTK
jgi:hypothetical protein